MKLNAIEKLISMLPAGEKRDALMRKFKTAARSKENKDSGLHDEFAFQPKGHIMIEEIDANGEVLGVLADQPNLVVKGSEEILLRAFSGDPKRTLYKNRKIKEYTNELGESVKGISKPYNVGIKELTAVLDGEDVVPFHQNEIWNAVNDDDFEIEYSYYPNTLYVKAEDLPLEPDMTTFKLYNKENAPSGAAPLQAEVYSNYTNLFIGLGDGKHQRISFTDERLKHDRFTDEGGNMVATEVGANITFTSKITNMKIIAKGEGSIKITADTQNKGTHTFNNGEESKIIEVVELDGEKATNIKIEMITGPKVIIEEIAFDEFAVHDNALMREFENYTLRFDTPTSYNTSPEKGSQGTFTIDLDHTSIIPETLEVKYNSEVLTKVETIEEVATTKFYLEADIGRLHFAEPLTGVLASYSVTGEIHEDEPATALSTDSSAATSKALKDSGDVDLSSQLDGVKTEFDLGFKKIQDVPSLVVELDGVPLTQTDDYTVNAETGILTLVVTPTGPDADPDSSDPHSGLSQDLEQSDDSVHTESVVSALAVSAIPNKPKTLVVKSFKYESSETVVLNTYVMKLKHEVKEGAVRVQDHTGKELTKVEKEEDLAQGKFFLRAADDEKLKELVIVKENANKELIQKVEVFYKSAEKPGEITNYTRQVIEKPKTKNEYPWFQLDKGKLVFVAEFPEKSPSHNVTIREMGLFDGPRTDDKIRGFNKYNVKAFSLVRVGETRKEATTGLRVTWTITLLNEKGDPFRGGL